VSADTHAPPTFSSIADSEEWRKQVHEVLQDTEKSFAQFRAMRQEAQHLREQERAKIADYAAALAKATSGLQKHIANLHPSRTNCHACRKQVKESRTLIKRSDKSSNEGNVVPCANETPINQTKRSL